MSAILLADELPQDVSGAEAMLANHIEHKGEIDARQASFNAFKRTGEGLIANKHYASSEVCTVKISELTLNQLQWNPQMWTPWEHRKSVLIREVS